MILAIILNSHQRLEALQNSKWVELLTYLWAKPITHPGILDLLSQYFLCVHHLGYRFSIAVEIMMVIWGEGKWVRVSKHKIGHILIITEAKWWLSEKLYYFFLYIVKNIHELKDNKNTYFLFSLPFDFSSYHLQSLVNRSTCLSFLPSPALSIRLFQIKGS